MSWRIFATATADPDFGRLTEAKDGRERGPVRLGRDRPSPTNSRTIADIEVFEDVVPSGYRFTYFVNEAEPYVAILRIRAT